MCIHCLVPCAPTVGQVSKNIDGPHGLSLVSLMNNTALLGHEEIKEKTLNVYSMSHLKIVG